MKKLYKMVVCMILIFPLAAFSQQGSELAKVGTAGAQFLKLPVGARGSALSNSMLAKVEDASAAFWNPAGLARIQRMSAFYSHSSMYFDMSFDGAAFAYRMPRIGTFGMNLVYFSSGDIEETTVAQQNGTGNTFQYTDFTLGASYSRRMTNRFSVGANVKYVQESFAAGLDDNLKAGNVGFDLGLLYYTDFSGLTIGMSVKNFGSQLRPEGTFVDYDNGNLITNADGDPIQSEYKNYHMPLVFQFGSAFEPVNTGPHNVTVYSTVEHPNDNVERINLGLEYGFDIPVAELSLRGGYTLGHDVKAMSFGAGLNYNGIQFDYALVDYGLLNYVNTFSVGFTN